MDSAIDAETAIEGVTLSLGGRNIAEDMVFYVKGIDVRHHAEVAAKD